MISRSVVSFVIALYAFTAAHAASAIAQSTARHRLQQQQLQDEMTLRLQQDIGRHQSGLTLRDQQKLDDLVLRQRLEQQQLEQQQVIESRQFPHDRARTQAQQDLFAQERALQLQRFRSDQQKLLQSTRPAPLQAPPAPGELTLP